MIEYDISHLAPHTLTFVVPADIKKKEPELKCSVLVSYSDHCYTKAVRNSQHREFDLIRYELSKKLPEIICSLMERRCSFAVDKNFFTVEMNNGHYEIYFVVYKNSQNEIALKVQSAYVRDPERLIDRPRWRTINFSTILRNVFYNKPMRPPR